MFEVLKMGFCINATHQYVNQINGKPKNILGKAINNLPKAATYRRNSKWQPVLKKNTLTGANC